MRESLVNTINREEVATEKPSNFRRVLPAHHTNRNAAAASSDNKATILPRRSTSPHRARDPSPRVHQKYLEDDEGIGLMPASS